LGSHAIFLFLLFLFKIETLQNQEYADVTVQPKKFDPRNRLFVL